MNLLEWIGTLALIWHGGRIWGRIWPRLLTACETLAAIAEMRMSFVRRVNHARDRQQRGEL